MGRLLHYVYKIPHRGESVKFYRDLGMKSLRHEEFTEGCEAQVRRHECLLPGFQPGHGAAAVQVRVRDAQEGAGVGRPTQGSAGERRRHAVVQQE